MHEPIELEDEAPLPPPDIDSLVVPTKEELFPLDPEAEQNAKLARMVAQAFRIAADMMERAAQKEEGDTPLTKRKETDYERVWHVLTGAFGQNWFNPITAYRNVHLSRNQLTELLQKYEALGACEYDAERTKCRLIWKRRGQKEQACKS